MPRRLAVGGPAAGWRKHGPEIASAGNGRGCPGGGHVCVGQQPRSLAPGRQSAKAMLLTVELPDRPAAGATVFEDKGCARCHSIGGDGSSRIGPDLGRVVFVGDVLDLAGAFWNHAPVMRKEMAELRLPRPTLTAGETANPGRISHGVPLLRNPDP